MEKTILKIDNYMQGIETDKHSLLEGLEDLENVDSKYLAEMNLSHELLSEMRKKIGEQKQPQHSLLADNRAIVYIGQKKEHNRNKAKNQSYALGAELPREATNSKIAPSSLRSTPKGLSNSKPSFKMMWKLGQSPNNNQA